MGDSPLLKNSYGPQVPTQISEMISAVHPQFDAAGFVAASLDGYDELELMERGRHIAAAMAQFLPADPAESIDILLRSLPSEDEVANWTGIAGFVFMPHGVFVANHGLACFEESMKLQYEITKRFTSEFSIRTFIAGDYDRTMKRLTKWAHDPNEHVRRLVSEGTRPRLPWAQRLPIFMNNPAPVIALLELLKDDPSSYVRRSVANNLNDIAKDNPGVTVEVAQRWWDETESPERRALIRHALRTLIKSGDPAALAVLGYASSEAIALDKFFADPANPRIGESVRIGVTATNTSDQPVRVLVDLAIEFVKANGSASPKVFKGSELELPANGSATVKKTVSLRQHTTRKHYPGTHRVAALVNGVWHPAGAFELSAGL